MHNNSILEEDWETILSLLPFNWEELAATTGAMTRKLRGFDSAEALLRTLLLHIAPGYSLRETAVRAKAAGLAAVSDVALLKRLRASEGWLKTLCCSLLKETGFGFPEEKKKYNIRLIDGTVVKEPGKTGSLWRIHYSLSLPQFRCDHFELTSTKGKDTAETLKKFPVAADDILIADRGFSYATDIQHVREHGGHVILRVNTSSLPFFTDSKACQSFDLLNAVRTLKNAGDIGEWQVYIKAAQADKSIRGRLCIIRKSEEAAVQSLKKLRRKSSKQQTVLQAKTEEFAKYVIVFTTLPKSAFSGSEILEWYRVRWQIELVFKRFKSIADLGHLPKYHDSSARAWVYGKLLVCLLSEKLVSYASSFSPWGYSITRQDSQSLEGVWLLSSPNSEDH